MLVPTRRLLSTVMLLGSCNAMPRPMPGVALEARICRNGGPRAEAEVS